MDELSHPPAMFRIRHNLHNVQIDLPDRDNPDRRIHRRIRLWSSAAFSAFLSFAGAFFVLGAGAIGTFGVIFLMALTFATLFPGFWILSFTAFELIYRAYSVADQVRLEQRLLRIRFGRIRFVDIPLASIQTIAIQVDRSGKRGLLRLETPTGAKILFEGLFLRELDWLAPLIAHHANRQRARLVEQGEDPDETVRPPASIVALVQRKLR